MPDSNIARMVEAFKAGEGLGGEVAALPGGHGTRSPTKATERGRSSHRETRNHRGSGWFGKSTVSVLMIYDYLTKF